MANTKRCYVCKKVKGYRDFNKDSSKEDGHQSKCRDCDKILKKKHYKENKGDYRKRGKNAQKERKRWLRGIKESTPCADCELYFPFYVMQFDHVRGEKQFAVSHSYQYFGKQKIIEEMSKCELVCANCHAIRTHIRGKQKKN